jgi:hypothetical protein
VLRTIFNDSHVIQSVSFQLTGTDGNFGLVLRFRYAFLEDDHSDFLPRDQGKRFFQYS